MSELDRMIDVAFACFAEAGIPTPVWDETAERFTWDAASEYPPELFYRAHQISCLSVGIDADPYDKFLIDAWTIPSNRAWLCRHGIELETP